MVISGVTSGVDSLRGGEASWKPRQTEKMCGTRRSVDPQLLAPPQRGRRDISSHSVTTASRTCRSGADLTELPPRTPLPRRSVGRRPAGAKPLHLNLAIRLPSRAAEKTRNGQEVVSATVSGFVPQLGFVEWNLSKCNF